jgi:hypothetical protein
MEASYFFAGFVLALFVVFVGKKIYDSRNRPPSTGGGGGGSGSGTIKHK